MMTSTDIKYKLMLPRGVGFTMTCHKKVEMKGGEKLPYFRPSGKNTTVSLNIQIERLGEKDGNALAFAHDVFPQPPHFLYSAPCGTKLREERRGNKIFLYCDSWHHEPQFNQTAPGRLIAPVQPVVAHQDPFDSTAMDDSLAPETENEPADNTPLIDAVERRSRQLGGNLSPIPSASARRTPSPLKELAATKVGRVKRQRTPSPLKELTAARVVQVKREAAIGRAAGGGAAGGGATATAVIGDVLTRSMVGGPSERAAAADESAVDESAIRVLYGPHEKRPRLTQDFKFTMPAQPENKFAAPAQPDFQFTAPTQPNKFQLKLDMYREDIEELAYRAARAGYKSTAKTALMMVDAHEKRKPPSSLDVLYPEAPGGHARGETTVFKAQEDGDLSILPILGPDAQLGRRYYAAISTDRSLVLNPIDRGLRTKRICKVAMEMRVKDRLEVGRLHNPDALTNDNCIYCGLAFGLGANVVVAKCCAPEFAAWCAGCYAIEASEASKREDQWQYIPCTAVKPHFHLDFNKYT